MINVKKDVARTEIHNDALEKIGMVAPRSVFGVRSYDQCVGTIVKNANVHTVGAQSFKNIFNMNVDDYESIGVKCNDFGRTSKDCRKDAGRKRNDKYRSIDGLNNNLKHPYWGASNTPYARFGSRNYEDGVYSVRKNLPNARVLVQEVLTKAVRSPQNPLTYNVLGLTIILFATHDLHYQVPMQPKSPENDIFCCSKDRLAVLPSNLSNTACIPIEISDKDDPLYKDGKVGCLNMVRAQIGEYPNDVQAGEIINQATAYLDLSLIYGNDDSELNQIRLFESGKFRMGKNNVLPVDSNGKYLPSMNRFVAVPIGSIWPSLFARNHNHLAERLAALNPHWEDEIIFQEARRINIASFQYNLITAKSIERVFSRPVNENYSELRNAATFIEFTYTYRGAHYYIPSHMLFLDEHYNQTNQVLQSDTMGKIELLEDNFDDALRGVTNQLVNTGPYSDEVFLK